MIDYEIIYEAYQHHTTVPQEHSRRLYRGNSTLVKKIKNQKKGTDLYITKYADDNIVRCVILDFDDKDNPDNALRDAHKLKLLMARKGLNTVIVKSGSKGYHVYIQTSIISFGNDEDNFEIPPEDFFNKFVNYLIRAGVNAEYPTLDLTNTGAGLRGNIRVIGSIHPKTGNTCEIIEGEFKEIVPPNEFVNECLVNAYEFTKTHLKHTEYKEQKRLKNCETYNGDDNPVNTVDLRELMPSIYGGEVKRFSKGYIMMQCPFHNDNNPSMRVTEKYYYCTACGEKGNWWNLRDKGVVDFEDEEYIRVGKSGGDDL